MREIHTGHMVNVSERPQVIFLRHKTLTVAPGKRTKEIPLWKCRDLLRTSYFHPCPETEKKLTFKYTDYVHAEGLLSGSRCFILGSGASIDDIDLSKLKNEFVIAINHSIIIYPDANALLFIDRDYVKRRQKIIEKYQGLIFAPFRTGIQDVTTRPGVFCFPFNHKQPQDKLSGGLYNGSLAGLCALSLALIMGAAPVYLLGFDLNQSWEDTHANIDSNVPKGKYSNTKWVEKKINMFKKFIPFRDRVVNCSMDSGLWMFDKKEFKDII